MQGGRQAGRSGGDCRFKGDLLKGINLLYRRKSDNWHNAAMPDTRTSDPAMPTPAMPDSTDACGPETGQARRLLAQNLVRLRLERGMSQENFADACGLHRTFIGHVERRMRNASIDNVERMAQALGVPLAEMFNATAPVVLSKVGRPRKASPD